MLYLWEIPEHYKNRDIGLYNRDGSPDEYLLSDGRKLTSDEFGIIPSVNFKISKARALTFDCLHNNSTSPLVNNRVKTILEQLAPKDVQFFAAKLICRDGELDNYYFLNITHTIIGIDHEKSIYTKPTYGGMGLIHYLTYKPGSMSEHELVRDDEYKGHLLVSEKIKTIFEQEHITGVRFVRPEDYYNCP